MGRPPLSGLSGHPRRSQARLNTYLPTYLPIYRYPGSPKGLKQSRFYSLFLSWLSFRLPRQSVESSLFFSSLTDFACKKISAQHEVNSHRPTFRPLNRRSKIPLARYHSPIPRSLCSQKRPWHPPRWRQHLPGNRKLLWGRLLRTSHQRGRDL